MLQVSKVKQKLHSGQRILRGFLRFPDPASAEIMALAGVDLIRAAAASAWSAYPIPTLPTLPR